MEKGYITMEFEKEGHYYRFSFPSSRRKDLILAFERFAKNKDLNFDDADAKALRNFVSMMEIT